MNLLIAIILYLMLSLFTTLFSHIQHYHRIYYFLAVNLIVFPNQFINGMSFYRASTHEMNISPLSRLPRELLNHIASFLIFNDYETDQELHARLKRGPDYILELVHANKTHIYAGGYLVPFKTPYGIVNYNNQHYIDLTQKISDNFLYPDEKIILQKPFNSTFYLSENKRYFAYFDHMSSTLINKIHVIDLRTGGGISFIESTGLLPSRGRRIALSNTGGYIAYTLNNQVTIFKVENCSIRSTHYTDKIKKLEFNKQSTKLGVLFQDGTCSFISNTSYKYERDLPMVHGKLLERYFKDKGICRNLIKQLANENILRVFDIE